MALGTTNITTTLVGQTIGVASRDVGTLCSSSLINKWSKYKPVIYPVISTDGITNWWKAIGGNCGLSITEYSDIDNLVTAIINGVTWAYNKPTGGASSPYRLGDFRGYAHDAVIPFKSFYVSPIAYNNSVGSAVGASISISSGEINSLAITDINRIKDWYFGCYMVKSSGSALYPRYITTANPVSVEDSSVEIPIYGLPSGTYYVYPFLCQNPRTSLDIPESSNAFVAFEGITRRTVDIANNPIVVFIVAGWSNDNVNSGVIEMEIRLTNNSSSSVTLQNCDAAMRYGSKSYQDPYLLGEKSESLGSITIPANSTVTRNLSFLIKNSNSTSGWKAWFSSTSPYSIIKSDDVMDPF